MIKTPITIGGTTGPTDITDTVPALGGGSAYPDKYYYPMRNTTLPKPYGDYWEGTFSGGDVTFVPGDGIYKDTPLTRMNFMFFGRYMNVGDPPLDPDIAYWDVSTVYDFEAAFRYVRYHTELDLSRWDMSGATRTKFMFWDARELETINASGWNLSNVTDAARMFYSAYAFNDPSISNWTWGSVQDMSYFFYNCRAFNQNVNAWDVSSANNLSAFFYNNYVYNQPLDNWDVTNNQRIWGMFRNAYVFNQDISGWNVNQTYRQDNNDTWSSAAFAGATAFNQDLSNWTLPEHQQEPTSFSSGATAWTNPNWRPTWGTPPQRITT